MGKGFYLTHEAKSWEHGASYGKRKNRELCFLGGVQQGTNCFK